MPILLFPIFDCQLPIVFVPDASLQIGNWQSEIGNA